MSNTVCHRSRWNPKMRQLSNREGGGHQCRAAASCGQRCEIITVPRPRFRLLPCCGERSRQACRAIRLGWGCLRLPELWNAQRAAAHANVTFQRHALLLGQSFLGSSDATEPGNPWWRGAPAGPQLANCQLPHGRAVSTAECAQPPRARLLSMHTTQQPIGTCTLVAAPGTLITPHNSAHTGALALNQALHLEGEGESPTKI
ncbi:MAG: hypothetical protein J3K34DRAFT_119294 [Monoraphidium minutum]|nr:MAG: hypothetical protein J3K34DRAFT_119294 [Monoraphidium minutum]